MSNKRPIPTPEMAKSFLLAITLGEKDTEENFQLKQNICRACDKKKTDKNQVDFCGMCGCSVAGTAWRFLNLCAYKERWEHGKLTSRYGCKHPLRKFGKGWPRPE